MIFIITIWLILDLFGRRIYVYVIKKTTLEHASYAGMIDYNSWAGKNNPYSVEECISQLIIQLVL